MAFIQAVGVETSLQLCQLLTEVQRFAKTQYHAPKFIIRCPVNTTAEHQTLKYQFDKLWRLVEAVIY